MATAFETEPCTRCGGTGHYSFNGEHSRCYKCDGKNGCRAYTKRGEAAKQYYLALRNKPIAATAVCVGMAVVVPGWKRLRVVSIDAGTRPSFTRDAAGVATRCERATIVFTNADGKTGTVDADATVTLVPSEEANAAMIAEAVAYQDTLTKAGKPRK